MCSYCRWWCCGSLCQGEGAGAAAYCTALRQVPRWSWSCRDPTWPRGGRVTKAHCCCASRRTCIHHYTYIHAEALQSNDAPLTWQCRCAFLWPARTPPLVPRLNPTPRIYDLAFSAAWRNSKNELVQTSAIVMEKLDQSLHGYMEDLQVGPRGEGQVRRGHTAAVLG